MFSITFDANSLSTTLITSLIIAIDIGAQLRADDPAALKDIILLMQTRYSEIQEQKQNSPAKVATPETSETKDFNMRVQFMLDMIYDMKNNKKRTMDHSQNTDHLKALVKQAKKGKPIFDPIEIRESVGLTGATCNKYHRWNE